MTDKENVHAALEGEPVSRTPVAASYSHLYHCDHFAELTGRPAWELWKWKYAAPDEHLATFRTILEAAPFDILQPQGAPSRHARENTEIIEMDGEPFLRNREDGSLTSLSTTSGHPVDYRANETQFVSDRKDADERVKVTKAEDLAASGTTDYLEATVREFGADRFVLAAGVVGTLWSCHWHLGQTNLLAMLIQQPDLVDYLSRKLLEQTIESIRQLASTGADAIFIDDAMGTSDVISVAHYERFCLPFVREMVAEIHRLGLKAIVVYFGGVADRLEQLAALGADGLGVETSMKGYINDLGQIAAAIGDRVSLFGNVDPIAMLEKGTDHEVEAEVCRQAEAGAKARGFIASTGSPITPGTPLPRVRRFIELGRQA